MAVRAAKRQKVEHSGSEDDDKASFASFDDSEDDQDVPMEEAGDGGESRDDAEEDEEEEEEEEEEDEDESGISAAALENVASTKAKSKETKPNGTTTKDRRKAPATGAMEGAFMNGAFKSNMFKLQTEELLEQIRPRRGKREEAAEQALHAIKKTIDQTSSREPLPVSDAERQLLKVSRIAIPFPEPRPPIDAKYKLEYQKPTHVNVIGSHALKTASRSTSETHIDMTVQMPSGLFQEKDYLNLRYIYKRAYYVACVAAAIKDAHSEDYALLFEDFHGDCYRPILIVTPKEQATSDLGKRDSSKRWRINIIPCIPQDVFSKDKLLPSKNCLRADSSDGAELRPTPQYNSSIRADMLTSTYLKVLHGAATSCAAFRDVCILGRIWLKQRAFGSDLCNGGFGHFEWSALTAILLQGGGPGDRPIFSSGYSTYQLFKAVLQVVATKDCIKTPFIIGSVSTDVGAIKDGRPMVWDAQRAHNVLHKMSPWAYSLLRSEARSTLKALGDQTFDGFDAIFILKIDNALIRYDCVLELPLASIRGPSKKSGKDSLGRLYEVLCKGLGDRATQVNLHVPSPSPWSVGTARPSGIASGQTLHVGIVVNAGTVHRSVDHGPLAENKVEAASFRKFWGEKAELRRFKDGSILESLVWSTKTEDGSILHQITQYLLRHHFDEKLAAQLKIYGEETAQMIRSAHVHTSFQPMMEAFKKFEADIRGLEELPLAVRQILSADPQLRFASIDLPASARKQRPVPADVVIQFEGSARWPDDLDAIQRTKIAFLLNLSESLEEHVAGLSCRIGIENEDHSIMNQAYLEVVYDTGAAFHLRIYHDREQTLLEKLLKDKSINQATRETTALGLANYKKSFLKIPGHTQAIGRLCSRYPALSGTMRIVKKWFASHLLAQHIAEEVVELIVARAFVQPWPWQAPNTVHTGLLRTLHWLSRWDWKTEPVVIDLSGENELKQADVQAIQTRFEAWRKLDPNLNRVVLFAASNLDTDGTTWTDGRPAKVIAGRMTALAKAAMAEVESKGLSLDVSSLFHSPLSDFDFVLHLDPAAVGSIRRKSDVGHAFKNLELASLDDTTMIGYEPADYLLQELERIYAGPLVFFSGGKQRPIIAGLWTPHTAPRNWRVNLDYSTMPAKISGKEDVQAVVNKEAMLAEMAHLGGGLIERVEINRH